MGWVKRSRVAASIAALFFVVACVPSDPVVQTPAPGPTTVSPSPTATATSNAGSQPGPGGTVPGSAPGAVYDDDGPVGAMARVYLRSSPAPALTIEVDWVGGRDPAPAAVDSLRGILDRELDKSSIALRRDGRISASRTSWTIRDLVALERANRGTHSGGSRATMWIVYVRGSFAPNQDALAVAFAASSVAIFPDRIDAATTALLTATEIERSVLVHEAGHLLALVNIGYRSRFDHEDPAHPNHSNNPGSVMYWAIEDISIRNLIGRGPPSDFDAEDRADLAMLRGS